MRRSFLIPALANIPLMHFPAKVGKTVDTRGSYTPPASIPPVVIPDRATVLKRSKLVILPGTEAPESHFPDARTT